MELYEFEVWLSTHDELQWGIICGEIRKYIVAEVDLDQAYRTAIDMAWRGEAMVTKVWWVA